MANNNSRSNLRRNAFTVRFTDEETSFLDWYSKTVDCDKSNAPRMIMNAFLTEHPELHRRFLDQQDTSSQSQPVTQERTGVFDQISTDPQANAFWSLGDGTDDSEGTDMFPRE